MAARVSHIIPMFHSSSIIVGYTTIIYHYCILLPIIGHDELLIETIALYCHYENHEKLITVWYLPFITNHRVVTQMTWKRFSFQPWPWPK